jgi:2-amino-4-hydroxy-6-hydroxymethyldihydropteridine diphosphokinase
VKYQVHLSLGSNVDKERHYPAAVRLLAGLVRLEAVSPVYETEPVGMAPGTPPFFNGAVRLATDLAPSALKARLRKEIEEALGRVRDPSGKWVSRPIDVDIALCRRGGDFALPPDPDVTRYLHVARPLADLDSDLVLPIPDHPDGRTLAAIARELEAQQPLPVPRPDIILKF